MMLMYGVLVLVSIPMLTVSLIPGQLPGSLKNIPSIDPPKSFRNQGIMARQQHAKRLTGSSGPHKLGQKSRKEEKFVGDWFLVFRAESGNNLNVVSAFMNPHGITESNASPGCTSTSKSAKCTGHYRHSALDRWDSIQVQKVKLELSTNGVPVAFVVFDGRKTGWTSWFARNKVLYSSWTDLSFGGDYFSFFGIKDEETDRRLYINRRTSGCSDDEGWLMVLESRGKCEIDSGAKHAYPAFIYSPHSYAAKYRDFGKKAEILAIYIQAEGIKASKREETSRSRLL